jgi:TonB family protein
MWMLRQDLRAIHEYEADAAVLSQGINMRQYQYLLIQKAVSHCGYSVANGISHSTLKNRINMMLTNKKNNRASWLKLLALLPIVGSVLALNAETVTDYVYEQPQKKVIKKGKKAGQIKMGAKTIEVKTDEGAYTGENVIMEVGETDTIRGQMIYLDKVDSQGDPLVIIDGKKSTKEQLVALDSKTIDHIDVLKDKTAAEIYGEEGKNGVIIITTKGEKVLIVDNAKVDSTGIEFKEAEMETTSEFTDVFDVVEQMPEFPGGMEAMMQFLKENVSYPETAFKAGVQGRVIVSFIVNTDGRINNVKVVRKVKDDLDAEAVRVVGAMPRWKPGMQKGQPVRVKYTLPITFRLK